MALPQTDWIEWLPGVVKQRGFVLEQYVLATQSHRAVVTSPPVRHNLSPEGTAGRGIPRMYK